MFLVIFSLEPVPKREGPYFAVFLVKVFPDMTASCPNSLIAPPEPLFAFPLLDMNLFAEIVTVFPLINNAPPWVLAEFPEISLLFIVVLEPSI